MIVITHIDELISKAEALQQSEGFSLDDPKTHEKLSILGHRAAVAFYAIQCLCYQNHADGDEYERILSYFGVVRLAFSPFTLVILLFR